MLRAIQTLLVHERNQQQAMQRAVQAKAQGLDPAEFATVFPGSTVHTTTTNHTGGGLVKGALLAAVLTAAGSGATWGLLHNAPAPASTQAPTAAMPAAPKAGAWDAIYEELQPDGTWKQIRRERLKEQ